MKGKVIKCVKNRYTVLEKNKLHYCKLKNSLSMKKSEFSNPIAVGEDILRICDKDFRQNGERIKYSEF